VKITHFGDFSLNKGLWKDGIEEKRGLSVFSGGKGKIASYVPAVANLP